MERGSDKHGFRADETLSAEVEGLTRAGRSTRAEEWKDAEPSGEDQPNVDRSPEGALVGGTPPGMSPEDVELRSEIAQRLGRAAFPGEATTLRETAVANGAPDAVLALLDRLPRGRAFANVQEVWDTLGGGTESRRF